jgi:hypothetical protein
MGKLDRAWQLFNESFNVLNADIEILLFPVADAWTYLSRGFSDCGHHDRSWLLENLPGAF